MSDTHFDESTAPYSDPDTFISLWNAMAPIRRANNVGLFVDVFGRVPTENEIKQGVLSDNSPQPDGDR